MSKMVFPRSDGFCTHPLTGMRVFLRRNQPWSADDELVREKPHLFALIEELTGEVEQASAAPGDRRRTRRPS